MKNLHRICLITLLFTIITSNASSSTGLFIGHDPAFEYEQLILKKRYQISVLTDSETHKSNLLEGPHHHNIVLNENDSETTETCLDSKLIFFVTRTENNFYNISFGCFTTQSKFYGDFPLLAQDINKPITHIEMTESPDTNLLNDNDYYLKFKTDDEQEYLILAATDTDDNLEINMSNELWVLEQNPEDTTENQYSSDSNSSEGIILTYDNSTTTDNDSICNWFSCNTIEWDNSKTATTTIEDDHSNNSQTTQSIYQDIDVNITYNYSNEDNSNKERNYNLEKGDEIKTYTTDESNHSSWSDDSSTESTSTEPTEQNSVPDTSQSLVQPPVFTKMNGGGGCQLNRRETTNQSGSFIFMGTVFLIFALKMSLKVFKQN